MSSRSLFNLFRRDVQLNACRSFCLSRCRNVDKESSEIKTNQSLPKEKFVYPKRPVYRKICRWSEPLERPMTRVKRAFKYDYETAKGFWTGKQPPPLSAHGSDVLVIGGGILGTCIAHAITSEVNEACSVVVVERDPPEFSSSLRIGYNGIHLQIPCKQYLEMVQYGADFYRKLSRTYDNPDFSLRDVDFLPNSSLQLVTESGIEVLEDLSSFYGDLSFKHQLLSPQSLKLRFPWLNVDDIALGCLGMYGEGMYNPWKVLNILRQRTEASKTQFVRGNLIGFQFRNMSQLIGDVDSPMLKPCTAVIETPEGEMQLHNFALAIIAAGPETPNILEMLNFKNMEFFIPIEERKRFMYTLHCPHGPGIEMPMIMDPNGLTIKKVGLSGDFAVWKDPAEEDEPQLGSHDLDELYLKSVVLPALSKRVPVLEGSEVKASATGVVDTNVWDGEIAVDFLPNAPNIFITCGFENNEFAFAPAVGKYLAENIAYGHSPSFDFSVFGFDRFIVGEKLTKHKFS